MASKLRAPFCYIHADLVATLEDARQRHPDSHHYTFALAAENILRKYELELRAEPLDREQVEVPRPVCAMCGQCFRDEVRELYGAEGKIQVHPECWKGAK